MNTQRKLIILIITIILLMIFAVLNLISGSSGISFSELFGSASQSQGHIILHEIRIPKALTALIAGAALSISGLQMQTLFKNPLAGPHILGISSGAGLGVAILVMVSGLAPFLQDLSQNPWGIIIASCMGAILFMALIFSMALRVRHIMTLLIFGIMLSSAISAIIALIQYFSDASSLKTYVIWTMGSLSGTEWSQLRIMGIITGIGLLISLSTPKDLNQLLLGESYALSLGQNIKRSRMAILFSTALLTGAVTALCGPISFIGLAVPHLVRLLLKSQNHLWLLPLSALCGGTFLLACDWVCHWSLWGSQLPVNAITALIGAPFIILLILRNKQWAQ